MAEPSKRVDFPREFPGVHYYGENEEAAALRVIRQHSPFRYYGASFLAKADTLEKEFAAWLGRRYARAVSSCTNGLVSAAAAFGIGPGQEVLVPGFFRVAFTPVPSSLTAEQEKQYTAVFREAYAAAQ